MKVYISVPINGREEETFEKKYIVAETRAKTIIERLRKLPEYKDAEFVTTFDINPLGSVTEAQAMGRCVTALLESDVVFFDVREPQYFANSKGCNFEQELATDYGIHCRWIECEKGEDTFSITF